MALFAVPSTTTVGAGCILHSKSLPRVAMGLCKAGHEMPLCSELSNRCVWWLVLSLLMEIRTWPGGMFFNVPQILEVESSYITSSTPAAMFLHTNNVFDTAVDFIARRMQKNPNVPCRLLHRNSWPEYSTPIVHDGFCVLGKHAVVVPTCNFLWSPNQAPQKLGMIFLDDELCTHEHINVMSAASWVA